MSKRTLDAKLLLDTLTRAIEFHRTNPDDPHGIRSAVMVALTEVRDAVKYAANDAPKRRKKK